MKIYKLKETPIEERPRERMIRLGSHALSNYELIAILLRTGTKEQTVTSLAKEVLYHLNHLEDMKKIDYESFIKIPGIKRAKATTLLAAIELGKRLSQISYRNRIKIQSPYDVYVLLIDDLINLEQEHFIVLYLNIKSEIIKRETLYIGTINQMVIHPRDIYKKAVVYAASAMIFIHNHPTGDASPSKADIRATKTLFETSEIMGIDIIDHIIIGRHELYSLKSNKKIFIKS
ncbi:DNA repair protein RadC [Mycoplasmatota bacterium]|nr:DNA repair protein RadC [Mycoplasmatota bacterium]